MCVESESGRAGYIAEPLSGGSPGSTGAENGAAFRGAEAEEEPVALSERGTGVRIGAGRALFRVLRGPSVRVLALPFCPAMRCRNGRSLPRGVASARRAPRPARRRRKTKKKADPEKGIGLRVMALSSASAGSVRYPLRRRRMIQRRLLALRYSTSRSGKSENMPSTLSFLKDTSSTSLKSLKPLGRESLRSVQECSFMPF